MRGLSEQSVRVEGDCAAQTAIVVSARHRAGAHVSYVKASYPCVRLYVTYLRGSGSYCVLRAPFARRTERKKKPGTYLGKCWVPLRQSYPNSCRPNTLSVPLVFCFGNAFKSYIRLGQQGNHLFGVYCLTFRHRASSIQDRHFDTLQRTHFIYLINKYISLSDICLSVRH